MKNVLLLVGVIGLGAGAWYLYKYLYQPNNVTERTNLILGGIFFLAALAYPTRDAPAITQNEPMISG